MKKAARELLVHQGMSPCIAYLGGKVAFEGYPMAMQVMCMGFEGSRFLIYLELLMAIGNVIINLY